MPFFFHGPRDTSTLKVEAVYLADYETFEDVSKDLPRFIEDWTSGPSAQHRWKAGRSRFWTIPKSTVNSIFGWMGMEKSIYSEAYAEFLRHLRASCHATGLTQGELAARLGTTQFFVSKCERGERRLDLVDTRFLRSAQARFPGICCHRS